MAGDSFWLDHAPPITEKIMSKQEFMRQEHAHAGQCWKNNWSGGDPKVFIQVVDVLKRATTAYGMIMAQPLALC